MEKLNEKLAEWLYLNFIETCKWDGKIEEGYEPTPFPELHYKVKRHYRKQAEEIIALMPFVKLKAIIERIEFNIESVAKAGGRYDPDYLLRETAKILSLIPAKPDEPDESEVTRKLLTVSLTQLFKNTLSSEVPKEFIDKEVEGMIARFDKLKSAPEPDSKRDKVDRIVSEIWGLTDRGHMLNLDSHIDKIMEVFKNEV